MIFEKHSVHLNRLESFYFMPFASYLPTQIISGFKYYSYIPEANFSGTRKNNDALYNNFNLKLEADLGKRNTLSFKRITELRVLVLNDFNNAV